MPDIIETTDAAASSSTGYSLSVGQTAQGTLTTGADHDWFAVSLVAGQTYTFAMVGTGTNNVIDPYLRLYSTNGFTLLAQNDDGLEGNNSVITFTATASGTYYLDAGSYNNGFAGQYGLSATQGTKASFDTQMGAGVMDADIAWNAAPGQPAVVTYGFRQSPASYTVQGSNIGTFSQLTAAQIDAVRAMLQYYSEIANITFTEVNPGGYTDNATMLFANYNDPNDGAGAFAFYPGSTASTAQPGDVWLNTDSVSTTTLPVGSYSFFAIMHEIGHALGLSHPGLYNAAPGVSITYANDAQFIEDSEQYTVMSYFDEGETGAGNYSSFADTPMLFDVYALQQIYGTNTATRTGNTVYGFGSNAGAVYDFAINSSPALCIWDAGGIDTLDCSGFGQAQVISLAEDAFSSVGGIASNISIAIGAIIENALGGSGSDTITGNAYANTLVGGLGNDTLDGAGGIDTVDYSAASGSGVAANLGILAAQLISATEGSDTLLGIENLIGSAQGDALTGNGSANALTGNGGVDVLNGGGGADTLTGGDGGDVYYIDALDILTEGNGINSGIDTIYARINVDLATYANVENLVLYGGGPTSGTGTNVNNVMNALSNTNGVTLTGLDGDDVLHGSNYADTLNGGNGKDILFGYAALGGINTMNGGAEDDSYYSARASDVINENLNDGFDIVFATVNRVLSANTEYLYIYGLATSGTGNSLANTVNGFNSSQSLTLDGAEGNDVIYGSNQNDAIVGGTDNDVMYGYGGADTFRFAAAGTGADLIYGFDADPAGGQDQIDVSGRGFSAASIGTAILISTSGADTLITIGADTIRLVGIGSANVTSADFIF